MADQVVEAPKVEVPATPAVETTPEKYEVKVNGKKMEVTLEELKRAYSIDTASRQRFSEAEKKLKEAQQIKEVFSNKDIAALKQAGWSEEEIEDKAADFLIKRAQLKSMTPEQRQRMQQEAEYKAYQEEKAQRELLEKQTAQKRIEQEEAQRYQAEFLRDVAKADKETWLDLNDPIILGHIIRDVSYAAQTLKYDLPVLDAVRRLEQKMEKRGPVKKEYFKKLAKSSIKELDDNDLDAFLEKGGKGVRERSVAAIKRAEAPFAKSLQTTAKVEETNTPKRDASYYRNIRYGRKPT